MRRIVWEDSVVGSVSALWRYPVKSMLGEELEEAEFSGRGLFGDRTYALVDPLSGEVRNAKRARWGKLFGFRAALGEGGPEVPPVGITLPNGDVLTSDREDRDLVLSEALGKEVRLVSEDSGGSFFDLGAVHLLATASLARLAKITRKETSIPAGSGRTSWSRRVRARRASSRTVGSDAPCVSGTRSFWR